MNATSLSTAWLLLNRLLPPGAMLHKELRVASRQRRNYALRFLYVGLLTVFMIFVWLGTVRGGGPSSAVFQASRMAQVGRSVTVLVVWLQFLSAQVLAVVLLSGAVSGEIRQRTLDALLVTPISSAQVVLGKFASKLLQVGILVAASLPLLAVIRVFGGVPWDYLVSGLGLTFTAAAFAGALSLLFSSYFRRAHEAMLAAVLWEIGIIGGILVATTLLAHWDVIGAGAAESVVLLSNPFAALISRTGAMLSARPNPGPSFSCLMQCAPLLGVAGMALLLSLWRVHRLRSGTAVQIAPAAVGHSGAIRHVKGSPIVWKELRKPLFSRWRRSLLMYAFLAIVAAGILIVPLLLGAHVAAGPYILGYALYVLFIIHLAASAGAAVTTEREARTWPILLTTPLENRQIIKGKAMGLLRRNLPLLAPLPVLYALGILVTPGLGGAIQRYLFSVLIAAVGLVGTTIFLLGVGLYLSARLRKTTTAVAATFLLFVGSKFFCCGGLTSVMFRAAVFRPPGQGSLAGLFPALIVLCIPTIAQMGIGLLCLGAAIGRVRRDIF